MFNIQYSIFNIQYSILIGLLTLGACGCEREKNPVGPTRLPGRVVYHAFINETGTNTPQLFTLFPDSPDVPRRLTNTRTDDLAPRWSPDGSRIAFLSNRASAVQFFRLFVMNADGSNIRGLFSPLVHPEGDLDFSWSPDGQKIALINQARGFRLDVPRLYIVDVNTLERQLVANAPPNRFAPDWSPDGSRIAFVSNVPGSDVITLDILSYPALTLQTANVGLTQLNFPRWSPDSRSIAFVGVSPEEEFQIFIAEGSNFSSVRQVTDMPGGITNPGPLSWSPDGQKLLFPGPGSNRFDSRSRDFYVVGIDGSALTQLTSTPIDKTAPDWTSQE